MGILARNGLNQPLLQITFLEDVLYVANGLCLLLQNDQKDLGAIS